MAHVQLKAPVKLHEQYIMTIDGLGHSGEGVGRIEGFTVFVPFALPGETIKVWIEQVKKNYAKGHLAEILQAAPERKKAECPVYEACGGCQLQHLAYEAQLQAKRQVVADAIKRIGKLDQVSVHPVMPSPNEWHYRNKMQLPVGRSQGEIVVGCYAQGSHDLVPLEKCNIQSQANNEAATAVRLILQQLKIPIYNEKTGQGIIRHVMARWGQGTGQLMVVLVVTQPDFPGKEELVQSIVKQLPALTSLVLNINSRPTNVVLGPKNLLLWGQPFIQEKLGPFRFKISVHSFFQVNTAQAVRLYQTALDYAGLIGVETVLDAYCGTGTISLFLAQQAKKVVGIEVVAAAIADARENAQNNGVNNAKFLVGDVTEVLPKLCQKGFYADVVVVDPPRAGCTPVLLETIAQMGPKRIVYVSCNPSSLARDLAKLGELSYETKEIQPVDMFAQTFHVECVVKVERKHSQ